MELDGDHAFGDCGFPTALVGGAKEPLPHARQPVYRSGPGYLRLLRGASSPSGFYISYRGSRQLACVALRRCAGRWPHSLRSPPPGDLQERRASDSLRARFLRLRALPIPPPVEIRASSPRLGQVLQGEPKSRGHLLGSAAEVAHEQESGRSVVKSERALRRKTMEVEILRAAHESG